MCHLPAWSHAGEEGWEGRSEGFKCLAGSELQSVQTAAQVSCLRTSPPRRTQCSKRSFQPSGELRMFLKAVVLSLALVAVTGE